MPDIPANSTTTATVSVGGSFTDVLEVAGDRDWIAVTLEAGQFYEIALFGSGATPLADPYIRIYDAAGNQLDADDDDGPGLSSLLQFTAATAGTYYIAAAAFNDNGAGGYTIEIDEVQPPSFLDSIDWGTQVADTTIEVYFAAAGEVFDGETSLGWNAYEIQQAMLAFEQFSNIANVSFSITTNAGQADFQLVTNNATSYLGYFNPPGTNNAGVGVFSRTGTGWDETAPGTGGLEQGGYGFITLIHEFGHGMGLAHPHDNGGTSTVWQGVTGAFDSFGQFDLNQGIYTVMSYNDGWQLHPSGENTADPYGWQGTMMGFDIAVLQEKYGANTSFATGDDGYVLPDDNTVGTYFSSIWDAGGTDAITYGGSADATIDLRAAHLGYAAGSGGFISYVEGTYGGFTIANGVVIENASGGAGRDWIGGNDVANSLSGGDGKDTLTGGLGRDDLNGGGKNDEIHGGDGGDFLHGGGAADTFVYTSVTESGTGKRAQDRIEDFALGRDVIDLTGTDAAQGGTALDAFIWIDDGSFSGTAGELRWHLKNGTLRLQADWDGDGDVDFSVVLDGLDTFDISGVLI